MAETPPVATVELGTRLVVRTAQRSLPVRLLAPLRLDGAWSVPVMTDVTVGALRGILQVETMGSPAEIQVELVREGPTMIMRVVDGAELERVQRRSHVRVKVELPVRAALLEPRPGVPEEFSGHTMSIGGGGVALAWDISLPVGEGTRMFLELQLPDDLLIPAVVTVVAGQGRCHRVRFLDIAPIDVERLIALVFRTQRQLLAQRRR